MKGKPMKSDKKLTCEDCVNFKANGLDEKTCSRNVIGSVDDPEKCTKFERRCLASK